jgi:hypothetical protein
MVGADEFDIESLEIPTIDPPAAAQQAGAANAPPSMSDGAPTRRATPKPQPRQPDPVEEELGLVTPPSAGPPLWRVAESIEDFYGNGDGEFDAGAPNAAPAAAAVITPPPVTVNGAPAANAAGNSQPPAAPRVRRTPPRPDEWPYLDSSQSAFKALIRRLDEIAGAA